MPKKKFEWYLYMVRCRDGNLYTGIATDIERRVAEHQAGKGAKYLRGRAPLKLVFKKRIGSRSLALKVEQAVKKLPKCRKEKIIDAGMNLNRWFRQ
jgi:putative endonuclease